MPTFSAGRIAEIAFTISERLPLSSDWLFDSGAQEKTSLSPPFACRSAMNATASTAFSLSSAGRFDSSWRNAPKHISNETSAVFESGSHDSPIPIG